MGNNNIPITHCFSPAFQFAMDTLASGSNVMDRPKEAQLGEGALNSKMRLHIAPVIMPEAQLRSVTN